MAIADAPLGASVNRRSVILMFALFLGLLSLVAVREKKVECQPDYLTADDGVTPLTADDGVTLLTTGDQQCHLDDLRGRLPSWVPAILKRILLR